MARQCKAKDCPLFGAREVAFEGSLDAKVMAVGESPGNQEVRFGKPFWHEAQAGKKVRELFKLAGLNWDDIFVANSARCMINKDKLTGKQVTSILKNCRCNLKRIIKKIQPKVIIVLGDIALQQVLRKKGIRKARGRWHWSEEFNCWVMPTYHPAYILRNASFAKMVIGDLKMVKDLIKNKYKPVENKEELNYIEVNSIASLIKKAEKEELTIGLDTEGQGLDYTDPNHLCLSYSLSWEKGKGVNIILFEEATREQNDFTIFWPRTVQGERKKVLVPVYVKKAKNFTKKVDQLREVLESKDFKIYMMHGNHDVHEFRWLFSFVKQQPPKIRRYVMDIQSAVHLVDENIYPMADLTMIQQHFTDFQGDYKGEFSSKFDKADMLGAMREDRGAFTYYAVADSDVTRRAGLNLKTWMEKHPRIANYFIKFTMPTLETLMKMEEHGALIDEKQLPEVKKEIEKLMAEEEEICMKLIPIAIKDKYQVKIAKALKAEKHILTMKGTVIADALFDEDGFALESLKLTKGKVPSVDKDVRKLLLDKPLRKKPREFLIHFDLWSEYHTLSTRYIGGFEKNIKGDGRIHCTYSLCIASTGRVSSRGPNMMNNPKRSKSAEKIRKLIRAPEGYQLVAVDASQSELRWLAHVADEKTMKKIFSDPKQDIHTATAKTLVRLSGRRWRDLAEDEQKEYRRRAKAVNFGFIYGMGIPGFVRRAKTEYGLDLSLREGEAWATAYFEEYPGVQPFHKKIIAQCQRQGYVESPLGRLRRLPEIHSQDNMLRAEAERQAMNQPIQEPSSSACLMAANDMENKGHSASDCKCVLFIHDELIFEVRTNKVDKYAKMIKNAMENPPLKKNFGFDLMVPLVAEVKVGQNLAEMKEMKF